MKKKELRKKYRNLRNQLTENEIDEKSLAVANKLLLMPIWDAIFYHVFMPIETLIEVNTEFILHILQGKDKEIVIAKSNFITYQMTHFLLTDNTKLMKTSFNITEPVNGIEVPTNKIDVVFVPLLAYDKLGNRVGYGKGFYDKFLSACKPETIKIGLSFFEPEAFILDCNQFDVKLDYCVSPNAVFKF
jgi:5-formyltetrahydrofolate cyclo-ligase